MNKNIATIVFAIISVALMIALIVSKITSAPVWCITIICIYILMSDIIDVSNWRDKNDKNS